MLTGVLVGVVTMGITILAAGALSGRLGRLPVYLTGAAFVGLMAFPVFLLIDTRSPALIALALAIGIGGIGPLHCRHGDHHASLHLLGWRDSPISGC